MWAFLRVVVYEWILARLGLRWLLTLLVLVPLAIVFFVGIPTLLALAAIIFVAWRVFRRKPAAATSPPGSAPPGPGGRPTSSWGGGASSGGGGRRSLPRPPRRLRPPGAAQIARVEGAQADAHAGRAAAHL